MTDPRARQRLLAFSRTRPAIWRAVDHERQRRAPDNASWPSYVFLPLPVAGTIAARSLAERGLLPPNPRGGHIVREASELACYASWRIGQGIYRFDPALYDALIATPVTGDLPADVLVRLPEYCVYVETPGMTTATSAGEDTLHGYFAWLDYDPESRRDILTIGLDAEGCPLGIQHVPLVGSLDTALERVLRDWQDSLDTGAATESMAEGYRNAETYLAAARRTLPPLLSLLLYLCADEAEAPRPPWPQPKRTKRGWRLFAADKPRQWEVGVRLGAALRSAYQQRDAAEGPGGSGQRKRPHIRRAHWHTYLTGAGRTQRVLRWIPPVPVNVTDIGGMPAVVHRARDDRDG